MKNIIQNQEDHQLFEVLSLREISQINGGANDKGFWYDVAYVVGATLGAIWEFSRSAAEYQHSLPPNLKK